MNKFPPRSSTLASDILVMEYIFSYAEIFFRQTGTLIIGFDEKLMARQAIDASSARLGSAHYISQLVTWHLCSLG